MQSSQSKPALFALVLAFLLASSLSPRASVTTSLPHPSRTPTGIAAQNCSEEASLLDSLRGDVAAHPADFITFETEASASRFLAEHPTEAYRETQPQVISRGIVGYWGDKTLVLLPTLDLTSSH